MGLSVFGYSIRWAVIASFIVILEELNSPGLSIPLSWRTCSASSRLLGTCLLWSTITQFAAITAFNDGVFGLIVTDEDLRRNLRARLQRLETSAFRSAEEYLSQLLRDEREGILQTVNNYFAENIASIREERMRARLGSLGIQDGPQFLDIKQLMGGIHLSNDDQAIYDSHDTLKAFYKVALKRFTDNVIVQVTERYLLGPRGPVKLLSPELIGELSDGELADIASENFATSSARNELQARMDKLHQALGIARQAGI